MSFLIADGVVPSNEDRGYVLRRLMRRAIVQGRRIGIEPGFLPKYAQVVRDTMGAVLPRADGAGRHDRHVAGAEEEAFNGTLEQGLRMLEDVIETARNSGAEGIGADEAFRLHDTYGFPFDLTLELAAERGVGRRRAGLRVLDGGAAGPVRGPAPAAKVARTRARSCAPSRTAPGAPSIFTGYETTEQATVVSLRWSAKNGRVLAKLVESPFYATGGGQVHDGGVIECEDGGCSAKVVDVVRLGDDQALVLEPLTGELHDGERAVGAGGPPYAPRDRVQPHGHAPPARGAARAPRHPRAPGRASTSARTSCASTSPTARR